MLTLGSITREEAAARFPFLAAKVSGRRRLIKDFTHRDPDLVFWVYPDGRLHDARRSHRDNVPRGYEHIIDDEPDYAGLLRGPVASSAGDQLALCISGRKRWPYQGLNPTSCSADLLASQFRFRTMPS